MTTSNVRECVCMRVPVCVCLYVCVCVCLRYNRLTSVPESLSNCVNMDEFNVEGNNISQLPVRTLRLLTYLLTYLYAFSALTLLVGWQEDHLACKSKTK